MPCIPNYTPFACEILHYFDYENNSCPYRISADSFAKLVSMIETMNEQQVKFLNCI